MGKTLSGNMAPAGRYKMDVIVTNRMGDKVKVPCIEYIDIKQVDQDEQSQYKTYHDKYDREFPEYLVKKGAEEETRVKMFNNGNPYNHNN